MNDNFVLLSESLDVRALLADDRTRVATAHEKARFEPHVSTVPVPLTSIAIHVHLVDIVLIVHLIGLFIHDRTDSTVGRADQRGD